MIEKEKGKERWRRRQLVVSFSNVDRRLKQCSAVQSLCSSYALTLVDSLPSVAHSTLVISYADLPFIER